MHDLEEVVLGIERVEQDARHRAVHVDGVGNDAGGREVRVHRVDRRRGDVQRERFQRRVAVERRVRREDRNVGPVGDAANVEHQRERVRGAAVEVGRDLPDRVRPSEVVAAFGQPAAGVRAELEHLSLGRRDAVVGQLSQQVTGK